MWLVRFDDGYRLRPAVTQRFDSEEAAFAQAQLLRNKYDDVLVEASDGTTYEMRLRSEIGAWHT
jgi:hypothetical protein